MGEWYSLSANIYVAVLVDGISSIEKLVQMNILLDKKIVVMGSKYTTYTNFYTSKNEQYVRLWQMC